MNLKVIISILLISNLVVAAESNLYDEKLESLKSKKSSVVSIQEGWTVIVVKGSKPQSMWTFTPKEHPSHPAFIKRTMYKKDGSWRVKSDIKCGASKIECDKLVKQIELLDTKLRNEFTK